MDIELTPRLEEKKKEKREGEKERERERRKMCQESRE